MMVAIQNNDKYIGQLLVKDGVITDRELNQGLAEQKKTRDFLCSILVRLGFASEEKIFSILSLQIGVPYLSLKEIKVDPLVVNRIPASFAMACKCLPIKKIDDVVYVTMSDPMNSTAVREIKNYLKTAKIKIFLSGDADLEDAIKKFYGL